MPDEENFRFLHICNVETSEISPHADNFQFPHNCHMWKAEISPHDNFSPLMILVVLVTNIRSSWFDSFWIAPKQEDKMVQSQEVFGGGAVPSRCVRRFWRNCRVWCSLKAGSQPWNCLLSRPPPQVLSMYVPSIHQVYAPLPFPSCPACNQFTTISAN